MTRKITPTAHDQLQILRAIAYSGGMFARAALAAVRALADHPARGGWGECEQARRDFENYTPDAITASADELADAISAEVSR